jgi:FMN phosphatase YigB (HAD superfamily)
VAQVRALLFDVFGTVVDWRSGVIRDVSVLAAEHGRTSTRHRSRTAGGRRTARP